MKLAFCLYNYFPYGGLQRDFLRIALECQKRRHHITVYTMHWEGERPTGFDIHILPPRGLQNYARCRHFVATLKQRLHEEHYDAIVGFNKMPGLDIYYAADTCFQEKIRQQKNALQRLLPRYRHGVAFEKAVFAPSAATQILLLSEKQQADFVRHYQTPAQRFSLVPPGIDRNRIAPSNAADIRQTVREQLAILPTDWLLLMVGSGFKTKGLDRSLQAIAALPDALKKRCQLRIIGQDRPDYFQTLAKKLGIHQQIVFLGGRSDVPALLLAGDLLLHPAYNENTGTVLLESMLAGLPVLTTDVCGYAHYVNDANAGIVLASPFTQLALNQALTSMLVSNKRQQWQQNGLQIAKRADIFTMPDYVVDHIEILDKSPCN